MDMRFSEFNYYVNKLFIYFIKWFDLIMIFDSRIVEDGNMIIVKCYIVV